LQRELPSRVHMGDARVSCTRSLRTEGVSLRSVGGLSPDDENKEGRGRPERRGTNWEFRSTLRELLGGTARDAANRVGRDG